MGANFHYYTYTGDRSELDEYHRDEQDDQCEQFGNDTYAGHLGIMPRGIDYANVQAFASKTEAIEYLESNQHKWDSAMAVSFQSEDNSKMLHYLVGGWCAS